MNASNTPLVSVIIPCYNDVEYVTDAICSALEQSYPAKEVIVINDGSTDNSAEIIAQHNQQITFIDQENRGQSAARNAAIEVAKGELLAFLDADDYWDENFLTLMVQALTESDAGLAYCGWQNIHTQGPSGKPFVPRDYQACEDKDELLLTNARWPIHAALTYKKLINNCRGFSGKYSTCEDFELWLKIGVNHKLVLVPQVLAYYRHHQGTQLTGNQCRIALDHMHIQRDFIRQNRDFAAMLGRDTVRKSIWGELLRRAMIAYWKRDLETARPLFKEVMKHRYGNLKHWLYMLPSLLPLSWHTALLNIKSHNRENSFHE